MDSLGFYMTSIFLNPSLNDKISVVLRYEGKKKAQLFQVSEWSGAIFMWLLSVFLSKYSNSFHKWLWWFLKDSDQAQAFTPSTVNLKLSSLCTSQCTKQIGTTPWIDVTRPQLIWKPLVESFANLGRNRSSLCLAIPHSSKQWKLVKSARLLRERYA